MSLRKVKQAFSVEEAHTDSFSADRAVVENSELRLVIKEFWKDKAKQARFKFIVAVCLAALNIYFVTTSALAQCDAAKTSENFCLIGSVTQYTELVVVVGHALRVFTDCFLLKVKADQMSDMNPGVQVGILAHNLEVASSFSLLAFLPLPPKVEYWIANRKYFLSVIVTDPPILNGRLSLWRPSTWGLEGKSCVVKACMGLTAVVCLGTVQVLIPLGYCVFPFMAPVAFLVKMEGLPQASQFEKWDYADWLIFAGVLNQTGKLWDVGMVQQRAILRLLRRNVEHVEKVAPGKITQEIGQAAFDELGWVNAAILMSSLDSWALGRILSEFVSVSKIAESTPKGLAKKKSPESLEKVPVQDLTDLPVAFTSDTASVPEACLPEVPQQTSEA